MQQKLVEMIENAKIPDKEKIEMICVAAGLIPVGEINSSYGIKKLVELIGLHYKEYNGFLLFAKDKDRIDKLIGADKTRNDYATGLMWGYPSCCVEYFSKEAGRKNAFSSYVKETRKRINNREHIEYYFRDYVPCPACVGSRKNLSGRLEDKMEELLSKASPKLHESFNRIRNSKSMDFTNAYGEELAVYQFEDSHGRLQRVNYGI